MKIDNTVKKETLYILLGESVFCILMLSVYLVCGKFSLSVLFGALIGCFMAVLNFFLMGLTLQKAVKTEDEGNRTQLIRISQSLRLLLIAAVILICAFCFALNIISLLIPLFFPRITVLIRGIFSGKGDRKNNENPKNN